MKALGLALTELGYSGVYTWDTMQKIPGHFKIWKNLLQAKSDSKRLERREFEPLVQGFEVLADWPASLFAQDLIQSYPDAKVILTVRDDYQTWYRSFYDTVWEAFRRRSSEHAWQDQDLPSSATKDASEWDQLLIEKTPIASFPGNAEVWYTAHNQMIRDLAPPGKLLEDNVKHGWAPLCHFLGFGESLHRYPAINSTATFNGGGFSCNAQPRNTISKGIWKVTGWSFLVCGGIFLVLHLSLGY